MGEKRQVQRRDALRMLSPGPVVLVTSMMGDHPNVMTAAWLLPLSLDPVHVGVAIQPTRLTHEFISKTEMFAINIPTVDLMSAVHACGTRSGREQDKFETVGITPMDAEELDVPLVAECVGHIECAVVDRVTLGDHDLFVGQVLVATADDEAFNGVWNVDVDAGKLLHHLGGDRYAGLDKSYRAAAESE
ncbi:MAG TPA: flavin reductase family protein [Thermomicrobiales bacterium]